MKLENKDTSGLALGGALVASILGSLCCIGPLVLMMMGIGGAWIATLRLFEDYRYLMMGVAALCLAWAFRSVFLQKASQACQDGQVCARPLLKKGYQLGFWVTLGFVALFFLLPEWASFFY